MQYIVALTGGIGSGKSTVANVFSTLGVPVIDADLIARQIVNEPNNPVFRIIVQHFGTTILREDGSLNRSILREYIFNDVQEKLWLDSLLHPLIQERAEKKLYSICSPYVLWVVPLLIENNLQHFANRILVVDIEPEIQIARTLNRDFVDRAQIEHILMLQSSRQQRLSHADDVLDNHNHAKKIIDKIISLHRYYLILSMLEEKVKLNMK